jgi:hypothetical protein
MGTYENSAVRAVRFALKTQKALSDHALTCNIGITTGQCFCGTVGSSMRCVSARTSFLVGAHDIRFAGLSNPVQCHGTAKASPLPHLHRDSAHPYHICTKTGLTTATSAPRLGSPLATSAPGLGSPLPHLHQDWAQLLPHLHRDWVRLCRICTGTWRRCEYAAVGDVVNCAARLMCKAHCVVRSACSVHTQRWSLRVSWMHLLPAVLLRSCRPGLD